MFNLLPLQEKKFIGREYRLRLVTVGMLLLGVLGTVATVLLIPSFVISSQKKGLAVSENEALKKTIASQSQDDFPKILKTAGDQARALNIEEGNTYNFEIISDIVRSKTDQIKIYGLDIAKNKDKRRFVNVTGRAVNREALFSFARTLEKIDGFEKVDVPVSNFADASNIDFFISIVVK